MTALTAATTRTLIDAGLDPRGVVDVIIATLAEDLGTAGDITSAATVPLEAAAKARYVCRAAGVAAGIPVLAAIAELVQPVPSFTALVADGAVLAAGQSLAELTGSARTLLALERTSLNLVGHLCGIATATALWVAAVSGTSTRIRDTRKTMPLLRDLEKYAVRCGGGVNHRHGLDDAVLIKDNHVAAAGGVGAALDAIWLKHKRGSVVVQVEVDNIDELDEALAHGAPQILLDNFDVQRCRIAVQRIRSAAPEIVIEASGSLTLDVAADYASTGVDFLAVGSLTHSAAALDIGFDFA